MTNREAQHQSLEAFYGEDETRRRSPEADYGCWWLNGANHFERWSVSYIQMTGEVYAKSNQRGIVEVLGIVPPDPDVRHSNGLPYGKTYYRTLDKLLEGWAEHCGRPGGLEWIRERLLEGT